MSRSVYHRGQEGKEGFLEEMIFEHYFLKKGREKAFPVEGTAQAKAWRFEGEGAAHSHSGTTPLRRPPWALITRAASSGATPQEPSPWLALAVRTAVFESSWQPVGMVGCTWMGLS